MKNNIFATLENEIAGTSISEADKRVFLNNLSKLKNQKINLMITGATGSGKSSTINALFNTDMAKVGTGTDPETMTIEKYEFENLILWDSPGLGDGKENDIHHSKAITDKLNELDSEGNPLIDLVLVVLDGGSRDLGTSYELINNVIIPNLGKSPEKRILVAINQADMAMKGRGWDHEKNQPTPKLKAFLEEKVQSIKRRIKESTGVDIEPIYYSAGYGDGDEIQHPYNLSKLLYFILKHTPSEKRLLYLDTISQDKKSWESNENATDYNDKIRESLLKSFASHVVTGAVAGAVIGSTMFGTPGAILGGAIGAGIGAVGGIISNIFG